MDSTCRMCPKLWPTRKAKLRFSRHCMVICDGKISLGTSHNLSEFTIKPLVCLWVSRWLLDPKPPALVKSSWSQHQQQGPKEGMRTVSQLKAQHPKPE